MLRNVVVVVIFYCLKLCILYESNKTEVFNVQLICYPFRLICYSISFPICFRARILFIWLLSMTLRLLCPIAPDSRTVFQHFPTTVKGKIPFNLEVAYFTYRKKNLQYRVSYLHNYLTCRPLSTKLTVFHFSARYVASSNCIRLTSKKIT